MNKRIAAIVEYLKYFPNDICAHVNLSLCEYLREFDMEYKNAYYPRIDGSWFVINRQIQAGKNYYLTNSTTGYKHNNIDTIVIWHPHCGRLDFVDDKYWFDIEAEWHDLMDVLKSYNPLDYDVLNNTYLYDIENGKKLIADYDSIMADFNAKINKKIKEVQMADKKKEFEKLKRELEGL